MAINLLEPFQFSFKLGQFFGLIESTGHFPCFLVALNSLGQKMVINKTRAPKVALEEGFLLQCGIETKLVCNFRYRHLLNFFEYLLNYFEETVENHGLPVPPKRMRKGEKEGKI